MSTAVLYVEVSRPLQHAATAAFEKEGFQVHEIRNPYAAGLEDGESQSATLRVEFSQRGVWRRTLQGTVEVRARRTLGEAEIPFSLKDASHASADTRAGADRPETDDRVGVVQRAGLCVILATGMSVGAVLMIASLTAAAPGTRPLLALVAGALMLAVLWLGQLATERRGWLPRAYASTSIVAGATVGAVVMLARLALRPDPLGGVRLPIALGLAQAGILYWFTIFGMSRAWRIGIAALPIAAGPVALVLADLTEVAYLEALGVPAVALDSRSFDRLLNGIWPLMLVLLGVGLAAAVAAMFRWLGATNSGLDLIMFVVVALTLAMSGVQVSIERVGQWAVVLGDNGAPPPTLGISPTPVCVALVDEAAPLDGGFEIDSERPWARLATTRDDRLVLWRGEAADAAGGDPATRKLDPSPQHEYRFVPVDAVRTAPAATMTTAC